MIHALACPAAAPRPTAAVELREPHCALRPATEIGSGRARALNPLPWAAGASAAGRLPCLASPFLGGDSKAACRRRASQLAAHSATMGRSAISHGELAALLVDGEASMPSAWLYAPFEQQQSARSSTKPPSPLFAGRPLHRAHHLRQRQPCARLRPPWNTRPPKQAKHQAHPPKSQRSARSDGRFRGDSQS